jgi:hypothetical protein
MYISNAYGTQVCLPPGRASQLLDEGQKLVIHFLRPECATGDHRTTEGSRKLKAGRLRRVSNGGTATRRPEDEDADLGVYSENDGEEDEVEQDSEAGLESPTKHRRSSSNYQSSCIPVPFSERGWPMMQTVALTQNTASGRATCAELQRPRIGREEAECGGCQGPQHEDRNHFARSKSSGGA